MTCGMPGRRHARLIGEAAPAFDEHFRLEQQVRAAGFDEAHDRQFVLAGLSVAREDSSSRSSASTCRP